MTEGRVGVRTDVSKRVFSNANCRDGSADGESLPCPDGSRKNAGFSLPCPDASGEVPAGTSLRSSGRMEGCGDEKEKGLGPSPAFAEGFSLGALPCPDDSLVSASLPDMPGTKDWNWGLRLWTGGGGDSEVSGFCLCMAKAPAEICGLWFSDGEVQHSNPVAVHDSVFDEQEKDCPAGHPLPAAQKTSHSKLLGPSLSW